MLHKLSDVHFGNVVEGDVVFCDDTSSGHARAVDFVPLFQMPQYLAGHTEEREP